jgi:hypothetical protein
MLDRCLKGDNHSVGTRKIACPSYWDMCTQAMILGTVIGEGRHDLTILELARRSSDTGAGDAVERAVRDLAGTGLLSIDTGKIVPGQAVAGGTEAG